MKPLKERPAARAILRFYLDARKKHLHERYLRSPDSWYLKTLKGIHAGKRCFIIGNGPSLCADDLNRLKGEYTFAANRIYEIFSQTDWRPTYYLAVDVPFIQENYSEIRKYDLGQMFLRLDIKDKYDEKKSLDYPIEKMARIYMEPDTYFKIYEFENVWNHWSSYVSTDISDHFSNGYTVTFASIQMAIYMGFTEIYLLGVDFNYSRMRDASGKLYENDKVQDYFNGVRYTSTLCSYNCMLHAYQMAREFCDHHNIIIQNATRGGKLEVFERMTLEEILLGGGYGLKAIPFPCDPCFVQYAESGVA